MSDRLLLLTLPTGRIAAAAGLQGMQTRMSTDGAPPGAPVDG